MKGLVYCILSSHTIHLSPSNTPKVNNCSNTYLHACTHTHAHAHTHAHTHTHTRTHTHTHTLTTHTHLSCHLFACLYQVQILHTWVGMTSTDTHTLADCSDCSISPAVQHVLLPATRKALTSTRSFPGWLLSSCNTSPPAMYGFLLTLHENTPNMLVAPAGL